MYNETIQMAWNRCCERHIRGNEILKEYDAAPRGSAKKELLLHEAYRLFEEGEICFYSVVVAELGDRAEVEWDGESPVVNGHKYFKRW